MSEIDNELEEAARRVRHHAYAPYSKFLVGAAVRGQSGRIYAGANVENASYGLALCAERSAVAAAVAAGEKTITACAVVTSTTPPAAPCGMCRQVLAEFGADAMPIVLLSDSGGRLDVTLGALLPHAFRRGDLP